MTKKASANFNCSISPEQVAVLPEKRLQHEHVVLMTLVDPAQVHSAPRPLDDIVALCTLCKYLVLLDSS
jgi:hypothetical protein